MQHLLASCQLDASEMAHDGQKSTPEIEHASGSKKGWRPAPAETVWHTASRRTGRRAWLRALERAVDLGLVPGFNATTRVIVDVLETRMGFDTGHARYVLKDVMERTGLGRSAVTAHIKLLRETGWLAWLEHGSLRNAFRLLGRPGYAKTATVYAATIPPMFDRAVGNVVRGAGYEGRVVSIRRPVTPVDTAGKSAVENSGTGTSRTPSLWVDKEVGQVKVAGGKDSSTGQARTALKSPRRKKKHTFTGYKIEPQRIEEARRLARWARPLVNWLQRATLDQLSWVLLDVVARGWTDNQILLWLHQVGQEIGAPRFRPRFPHRVLAAALLRKDAGDTRRAHGHSGAPESGETKPNAAFGEASALIGERYGDVAYVTYPQLEDAPEDVWDRDLLLGAADPGHLRSLKYVYGEAHGRAEAVRLLGSVAVDHAEMPEGFQVVGATA